MIRKKTKILWILTCLLVGLVFSPGLAHGQIPFGGRIVMSIPCPYSGNWYLTIAPVAGPVNVIYRPGVSRLYDYGQVFRPGPNVLGTTMGIDVCVISVSPTVAFTAPMIRMVGTSF